FAQSRYCVLFFFSSRRRHTRFSRDWSSDVCSSDLHNVEHQKTHQEADAIGAALDVAADAASGTVEMKCQFQLMKMTEHPQANAEIGRASCRKEGRWRGQPGETRRDKHRERMTRVRN